MTGELMDIDGDRVVAIKRHLKTISWWQKTTSRYLLFLALDFAQKDHILLFDFFVLLPVIWGLNFEVRLVVREFIPTFNKYRPLWGSGVTSPRKFCPCCISEMYGQILVKFFINIKKVHNFEHDALLTLFLS